MIKYAIWGYGKIGHKFLKSAYARENQLIAIIDRAQGDKGLFVNEIPVINPEEFYSTYVDDADTLIVTLANGNSINNIVYDVKDHSSLKIGVLNSSKLNEAEDFSENDIYWLDNSKAFMSQIEMAGSEKCNLNCRACSHYCTAKTEQKKIDLEKLQNTLEALKSKCDIPVFYITGGEPLLNQDLDKLVEVIANVFDKSDLRIVSNGLLVDRQKPNLWECLKKNNVTYQMSGYPPTLDKKDTIVSILANAGVKYQFRDDVHFFYAFLSKRNNNNSRISISKCVSSSCRYLEDTRIYKCPESHLIGNLKKQYPEQIDIMPDGGVDVYDDAFSEKIKKLNEPIEMCTHCSENPKKVTWKRQDDDPDINDWLTE